MDELANQLQMLLQSQQITQTQFQQLAADCENARSVAVAKTTPNLTAILQHLINTLPVLKWSFELVTAALTTVADFTFDRSEDAQPRVDDVVIKTQCWER